MGKVIIELADPMKLKIKAKKLADAIEKLIDYRVCPKFVNIMSI